MRTFMVEESSVFLFLFDNYPLVKRTFGGPHQEDIEKQRDAP